MKEFRIEHHVYVYVYIVGLVGPDSFMIRYLDLRVSFKLTGKVRLFQNYCIRLIAFGTPSS